MDEERMAWTETRARRVQIDLELSKKRGVIRRAMRHTWPGGCPCSVSCSSTRRFDGKTFFQKRGTGSKGQRKPNKTAALEAGRGRTERQGVRKGDAGGGNR